MSFINKIILNAFHNAAYIYSEQMKIFYPTIGSRGIDERNQVPILFLALKNNFSNIKVFTWLESPFITSDKKQDSIDGVAYIYQKEPSLLLVEAKRIKQGKSRVGEINANLALDKINQDAVRMGDKERIKTFYERINDANVNNTKVYRIMMADIWLNKEEPIINAHKKWLEGSAFPVDWESGVFSQSEEIYKGSDNSSYRLLIAIHPDKINFTDCIV